MNPAYTEAIQQATAILLPLLRAHIDVVEDADNIDVVVWEVVREVGRQTTEQLMTATGEALVASIQCDDPQMGVDTRRPITMTCLFGPVQIPSPYLRNRQAGGSVRPLAAQLSWRSGGRTLAVDRALSDFGIEQSFRRASERFEEHYGFSIHRDKTRRIVHQHAQQALRYLQDRLAEERAVYDQPLEERPGVDEILVEMDGCHIRTGTLKAVDTGERTAIRDLPKARREEAWREVRVGFARPLDQRDKSYVAAMAKYPEICHDLFSVAVSCGLSRQTRVVSVGDGGNGLKDELERTFENFSYLLDLPHLRSNLYETAEAIGLEADWRADWVEDIESLIWTGQFDELFDRLERLVREECDRARQLMGFLTRYQDCLDYPGANNNDWPLGSGKIESAHRYLPQQRLKLPGAWWSPKNINPLLAMRVIRANGWWKDFWIWQRQNRQAAS